VADGNGHTAASVGRDAPEDNHHGFTVALIALFVAVTVGLVIAQRRPRADRRRRRRRAHPAGDEVADRRSG
jgi:hypothetical protein